MEIPSLKHELEEGSVHKRDADMPRKMLEKKRNHSVKGAPLVSNPYKVIYITKLTKKIKTWIRRMCVIWYYLDLSFVLMTP